MNNPDPAPIIDLMDAFRRSKTMFAAVNLGVFDLFAGGEMTAPEVSNALATDLSATQRLLEACAGLGLLLNDAGRFSNTPEADAYLRRESPRSLAGYILYSNQALYRCWGNLEDAIREGTPRWEQTFGTPGPIFSQFFSTPEKLRTFVMGMHGLGMTTSPAVVKSFDLTEFRTLADLGAATGHLAITACEAFSQLRGIVFDLPDVIPLAAEQIAASPARARLSVQAGDFFTDPLPAADLYSLGRILHDWGEEKIRILLRKIYTELPEGGGLLVAEKLLREDRSGPMGALLQSLSMLVVTEGKERTASEYRALLEESGFRDIEARYTGQYLDAVLARKR
jgi:acetylserotonin N-methyltransferase